MTLADEDVNSKIADIEVAIADGLEVFVSSCITAFRHLGDGLTQKVAIAFC